VRITWDPAKRASTLSGRGLDFADAAIVFAGVTIEFEDLREDYRETRIICVVLMQGRLVVIGYVPRGAGLHIFRTSKANGREQKRLAPYFEV
jgi:uncharacterized protein